MIFFTPGPSQLYPSVATHIQNALKDNICAMSHRSTVYKAMHQHTVEMLRALLNIPTTHQILFFASANEIWERLIQNCVINQSVHFVNGAFSERFFSIAQELQRPCSKIEAAWGDGFFYSEKKWDTAIDMLNFTHNESSTGLMQPLPVVYEYAAANPSALVSLDVVSSIPFVEVDFDKIDATYFSVQKGFGLPAGLGVLIASERVLDKAISAEKQGLSTGSYHRFSQMWKKATQFQTMETPNVLAIYLLGKVAEDMLNQGLNAIRKECIQKYELLENTVNQCNNLSFYVKNADFRSRTVLTIDTKEDSQNLIAKFKTQGFTIGDGYERNKGKQIRIANFPTHQIADMEALIPLLFQSSSKD